ncbi:MAG: pilus assembly protein TadB, partial [Planctomycetes bacterium]|nr:pilus assembly protein TadB [Planctomycetota bacterium]
FVMMYFLNRDYTQVLLQHPNSFVVVGISMGIGALWIRRIVNFDF